MKRVTAVLAVSAVLAGLLVSGCGTGAGTVTLEIPSSYECTVAQAAATDHEMIVNTPAVSSGHPFEIDLSPIGDVGRGSLVVHTALSPASTMATRGTTLTIGVNGSTRASCARFGVVTSTDTIAANASSGTITIRFTATGFTGTAVLTTEDQRVPAGLRTYTTAFQGELPEEE